MIPSVLPTYNRAPLSFVEGRGQLADRRQTGADIWTSARASR
jgi:hypothetical protein